MEIPVSVGEWMSTLQNRMTTAMDGDCFLLPTYMHLHAFTILKEGMFAERDFKVELQNNKEAQ
jgi:hypothetical protein